NGITWLTYTTLSTNSSGQFSTTFSSGVGTYLFRVSYAGNSTYNPSNQTQTLIVVGTIPTKISFTMSPNPANVGQTVALAGSLTYASNIPIPSAQVTVQYSTNGGTSWLTFTTLSTNSSGQFYRTFSAPGAGTYMVNCSYAGNSTYNPSSQTLTL